MAHKLRKIYFSLAVCCLFLGSATAQDDLYFSPKRQRELDRQQAERRANEVSVLGLKRGNEEPQQGENDYTESWGDVDSLGSRPNSKIYEITRNNEYDAEQREEDSYAERLRYDDPTYIVYARDPYWYDSWWGYPYAGVYGTWGGRWGWGLGWGYPYYGYGWGYPYYSWGYPYYYHHYYPGHYWGGGYAAEARGTHRGSNMSGTGRGTGYTNSRTTAGTYSGQRLSVPAGTYTQRTQGGYTRSYTTQPETSGTGSNRISYSNSGRSYQSIPSSNSSSQSSGSYSGSSSSPTSTSGSSSSSSSRSSYSGSSSSRSSYSGGSSSSSSGSSRSSSRSSSSGRRSSGR